MQIKNMIQVVYTKLTVRRWTVWVLCAALMGSVVSPVLPVLATGNEVDGSKTQDGGLIAHFTFDNGSDRLHDDSGHDIEAVLYQVKNGDPVLGSEIDTGDWNKYFDGTDDDANALHLNNNACLVLQETDLFEDFTEMTVEMKIKITESQRQHWLFYAAQPDTSAAEQCLGVGIMPEGQLRILRQKNNKGGLGNAEFLNKSDSYRYDTWYTVRAVYKVSSMALYVEGERIFEAGAPNKTADYFGEGKELWFGHSAWPDTNFIGYIDDIKIYNYAIYDHINEEDYIITDSVDDPDNTTVNMFDYWVTEQTINDFNPKLSQEYFLNNGINREHLFLFAGYNGSSERFSSEKTVVGTWNDYFEGDYHQQYEPYSGIVRNVLGNDKYPQLAIDQLIENNRADSIPTSLDNREEGKQRESLAYLFNPKLFQDGKVAYPDVTGLFRLSDDGYYYFNSIETYAELNKDQSDSPKISKAKSLNHITLYDKTWDENSRGQFFPFNDWSDLFYQSVGTANKQLIQANDMEDQATTAEPLNHYLGMTVTTEFQQPTNGLLDRGSAGTQHMTFDFSGDDDVWIFVDDVLVGDLGGLHNQIHINIDFATGKIEYTGSSGEGLTDFDKTLYEVFEQAGRAEDIEWNVVEDVNDEGIEVEYNLFPDYSGHTLKFFYLERGNAASNCSISFNLYEPEDTPTEQPPEEDNNLVNISTEQPPEEDRPVNISTAENDEKATAVVSGSPQTGDSSMVGLWITLLALSIAGIIVLTKVYYARSK